MNTNESRIMNAFIDYYDELSDSHLTEGCTGISDPEEISVITAGIATALTIKKLLEEGNN